MKKQHAKRVNIYMRLSGDDAILRNALNEMPRGSGRKLLLACIHKLIPGGFAPDYGLDRLVADLLAIIAEDDKPHPPGEPATGEVLQRLKNWIG